MSIGEFLKNAIATKVARWQTDASGNVTGLVEPDGSLNLIQNLTGVYGRNPNTGLEITPWRGRQARDAWSTPLVPIGTSSINEMLGAGGSYVHSVDAAVLWQDRPTSKVVITGAPSGASLEIGVSPAAYTLPAGAASDLLTSPIAVAVKGSMVTAASPTVSSCSYYIGDATYANYHVIQLTRYIDTADGWRVFYGSALESGALATTGTPVLTSTVRCKIRFTMSGGTWSTGDVWVGGVSLAKAARPTVIITADDGYDDFYTYLWPALRKRGLCASLGLDSAYQNTAGFLTDAQVKEMLRDGSVEFTNHGVNNQSYASVGLSAYLANLAQTDAYLSAIGVPPASRYLHAYVQGSYDMTLVAAMRALGYTSMREVGAANRPARPFLTSLVSPGSNTQQSRYALAASANLENGVSVSTVIGYIETLKSTNYGGVIFLMGHKFEAAAGVLTYVAGYDATHGMSNLLDYLAVERDKGTIDVAKWSDWVNSLDAGMPI